MTTNIADHLARLRANALSDTSVPGIAGTLTHGSVDAAWAKFTGPRTPAAQLLVDVPGRHVLDAATAAEISAAVQHATALIARGLRDPRKDPTRIYRGDIDKALLIQRGQVGANIMFEIERVDADADHLDINNQATLTEHAVNEIVNVLPHDAHDERAIDAIFGQRSPMKLAVAAIASVAQRTSGLDLTWTAPGEATITSLLTAPQATELSESLGQSIVEESTRTVYGRLDGMRTMRRLFYLEAEDGRELTGAIDTDLVREVQKSLNRKVAATLRVTRTRTTAGRAGRDHYLLTGLAVEDAFQ